MNRFNPHTREGKILIAGGIVALGLLAWYALEGPLGEYEKSKNQLRAARRNLALATMYHGDVVAARESEKELMQVLSARGNFDLWSHLSQILREMDLQNRGAEVATFPRGTRSDKLSSVRLNLKGVSAEELVDVLYRIHAGGHLVVMHSVPYIRQAPGKKGLDCSLIFLAPNV
ncbi:MAG: hypothetical protein JXR94_05790 [Candidatus Hydrogenedentes bacterium]|nr:hypothetical protein [Candidatus Hydrogenedentota bacterium]